MRSHEHIVSDFGATKLFRALSDLGRDLSATTPRRWLERDRIPMEWWADVETVGAATQIELRASHRPRKKPVAKASQGQQQAAA